MGAEIMSIPDPAMVRKSRTQLLLIFALFLIPPVSAWIVWQYLGDAGVADTTNAGTLVSPARPLSIAGLVHADGSRYQEKDLRGRWTYVLFDDGNCAERCLEQLYLTRQTRISMNKDVRRVQRLLVLAQQPTPDLVKRLGDEHSDLAWVVQTEGAEQMLRHFNGQGFAPRGEQYFLVDPLGNLMMFYDVGVAARGMRKDLQKLLKISQVG